MADRLPSWLGPLLNEKHYNDVEGLTLGRHSKKAMVVYPNIATCEEAACTSTVGQMAKVPKPYPRQSSYYNASPLVDTPTAVELLTEVLARSSGQGTAQVTDSTRKVRFADVLKSIKVDTTNYDHAIAMTRAGGHSDFGNLMSQGNLLLMADEPAQAQDTFVKACGAAKGEWQLPQAIDGIARSLRDEDGSLSLAEQFLHQLDAESRLCQCSHRVYRQVSMKKSCKTRAKA